MNQSTLLRFEFVKSIPERLAEHTLYISMDYATVAHRCCCGCGREVITPLSPTDWTLTYDGVSVSLSPSIGNWSFPCRSHYWVSKSTVYWAEQWSAGRIAAGRTYDRWAKNTYFTGGATHRHLPPAKPDREAPRRRGRFWALLSRLWVR